MLPGWLRRLTLGFLLCLSIDVANPLLPGSQRFDAAESIDGVRTPRPRGAAAAMPTPTLPPEAGHEPAAPVPSLRAGGQRGPPATAELAAMTMARRILPGAEPPAPADDH
jgi:hypothetical protein